MSDLNELVVTGRLGKDPEAKQTKSGVPFVSFSLASNTRKGTDDPLWRIVNCYKDQADFAQKYLRKGSRVHVAGEERVYAYTGQDGQPHAQVVIEASHIGILDSPHNGNGGGNAGGGYTNGVSQNQYAQQPAQNAGYAQQAQPPVQNGGYAPQGQAPVQNGYAPQGQPQQQMPQGQGYAQQQAAPRNGNYYDARAQQYNAPVQQQMQPEQQSSGMPNLDISTDDLPF